MTTGRRLVYGKIFKSIYYGSLAPRRDARELMIFLCVHADKTGFVDMTLAACGKVLGWTDAELHEAGDVLLAPDPDSTSSKEDGRRILARSYGARGVVIVNYDDYLTIQNDTDRKEYMQRYYKETLKPKRSNKSTFVNKGQRSSAESVDVERDRDTEVDRHVEVPRSSVPLFDADVLPPLSHPDSNHLTAAQAFDEIFWPEYPRKYAKAKARLAWNGLKLRDDDDALLERIMVALRRDVQTEWISRPPDKVPHPATWIHARRWED